MLQLQGTEGCSEIHNSTSNSSESIACVRIQFLAKDIQVSCYKVLHKVRKVQTPKADKDY